MVPKFSWKYAVIRYDPNSGWEFVQGFANVPSGKHVLAGDVVFELKYEVKQDPAPTPYLVEVI